MKLLKILVLSISSGTGAVAAYYWYKSSQVAVVPSWGANEPGDALSSQAGLLAGMLEAGNKIAYLNKKAARLTAISIFFNTIINSLS